MKDYGENTATELHNLRTMLAEDTRAFLARGGIITRIESGVSGVEYKPRQLTIVKQQQYQINRDKKQAKRNSQNAA
jgi:hypothetical protein